MTWLRRLLCPHLKWEPSAVQIAWRVGLRLWVCERCGKKVYIKWNKEKP